MVLPVDGDDVECEDRDFFGRRHARTRRRGGGRGRRRGLRLREERRRKEQGRGHVGSPEDETAHRGGESRVRAASSSAL